MYDVQTRTLREIWDHLGFGDESGICSIHIYSHENNTGSGQWHLSYLWLSVNLQKQVLKVNIHKPAEVSKFPSQSTDHTQNTATFFCCKLAFLAII